MIWQVYLKEMKDSIRDQKTILLSVIIPMLFTIGLIFFMENMMNTETNEKLQVAIPPVTNEELVEWLGTANEIELVTVNDPIQSVNDGEAVAAIISEETFADDLANNNLPVVQIVADPTSSKGSLASDMIESLLNVKKQEIVETRLIENNIEPSIIEPFTVTFENISGEDSSSLYMLTIFAQLIIVLSVLMGGLSAANDMFAGEKERKTMEALLMTPVKRINIIVGKWMAIASLSAISGVFSVVAFVLSINLFGEMLSKALNISDNFGIFTVSILVGIIFFALLIASLQMILSLLANNLKEAQNYISPISMLIMVPYFILIGISANELTAVHFIIPFFNIYALIKQLIYGIYDLSNLLLVAGSSTVFIIISFVIAALMFMKSKWVLGK